MMKGINEETIGKEGSDKGFEGSKTILQEENMNIIKHIVDVTKNKIFDSGVNNMTDSVGRGINRIKVFHVGNKGFRHSGIITVATQVMDDGSLYMGIAYCSPRDTFDKSKGRKIAMGRLQKGGAFHYHTKFTGNSCFDFKKVFNDGKDDEGKAIVKPNAFRKWYITKGLGNYITYSNSTPLLD
jgi:hypothetical protein